MDFNQQSRSMSGQHWVRIGLLGTVARFSSAGFERYKRGARVICRTQRGLEVGEVLAPIEHAPSDSPDGALLRLMTVEDELLVARLERRRGEAFEACVARLRDRGIPATLVDVEQLFDGQSLYFYFLGPTNPEIDAITAELAEAYEAQAQIGKFAETLTAGCGPGCGTEDAENGCASGACSTCAVVGACGTPRASGLKKTARTSA